MIPDGFPACPYPGLRPFELADSPVFFGQDENIEALIERLGRARFVAVLGESGVGKSSLVKAGLIPELRRGDTSLWRIVVFKPGVAPLQAMAEALAGAGLAKQADLVEAASNLRGHRASLRDLIASADLPAEERVLIVVDQFEELFRFRRKDEPGLPEGGAPNASDEEDAALFLKLLLTAAHTSEPPVYVLVTMRSEFLGDCAAFYELGEAMNQGAFLLPRMARHQFAAAITEPLKAYGCDIESPLLHELQNESMALTEDGLPLLQHALRRMWDQRAGDREGAFSMSDFMPPAAVAEKYSNRPALQVLLDAHLDKVYAEMEEAGLGTATVRLMQRLGDHDRKGRLVRRAVDWDTARAVAFWENAETTKEEREQNRELLGLIIGAFHDAGRGRFFLTGEADGRGGNSCRLELTHEVILRQWSRLWSGIATKDGLPSNSSISRNRPIGTRARRLCCEEQRSSRPRNGLLNSRRLRTGPNGIRITTPRRGHIATIWSERPASCERAYGRAVTGG